MTVKTYQVRGTIYLTNGRTEQFSTIVEATTSTDAVNKGKAEATRDYGNFIKRLGSFYATEIR